MQKIFVSHHYNDELVEPLVELVKALIQNNDMLCVRGTMAYRKQKDLSARIKQRIDDCDAFISIMTPVGTSNGVAKPSTWVSQELHYAIEKKKECLLMINAPPLSIPGVFERNPYIEFDDTQKSLANAMAKLAETLYSWKSQIRTQRSEEWRSYGEVVPVATDKVFMRWETLGEAIKHLYHELHANKPKIDALIGINEVGLACASYLSNNFDSKPIGYAMHHRTLDKSVGIRESYYPDFSPGANILIVDSLLKSGSAIKEVLDDIKEKKNIKFNPYLAVIGAERSDTGEALSAQDFLWSLDIKGLYVAYTFKPGVRFAQRCLNHTTHNCATVLDYTRKS